MDCHDKDGWWWIIIFKSKSVLSYCMWYPGKIKVLNWIWWWVMMVDDNGWWFVCIHYSFHLQEKMFKGSTTKKKTMGILQNYFVMVYLYKNGKNN